MDSEVARRVILPYQQYNLKRFPLLDEELIKIIISENSSDDALEIMSQLSGSVRVVANSESRPRGIETKIGKQHENDKSCTNSGFNEDDFPPIPIVVPDKATEEGVHDCDIATILEIFPDFDFEMIHAAIVAHNADFDKTVNYLVALDQSETSTSSTSGSGSRRKQRAHEKMRMEVDIKYKPPSSSSNSPNPRDLLPRAPDGVDPDRLRDRANEFADMRNTYFTRASTEFKKGGYARSVASYYSEEARKFGKKMEDANMVAAVGTVQENSREGVLDLHYLRVKEALVVLEHELEKPHVQRHLMVVTGRGTGRLYAAVDRYLNSKGFKYEKADGYFMVSVK